MWRLGDNQALLGQKRLSTACLIRWLEKKTKSLSVRWSNKHPPPKKKHKRKTNNTKAKNIQKVNSFYLCCRLQMKKEEEIQGFRSSKGEKVSRHTVLSRIGLIYMFTHQIHSLMHPRRSSNLWWKTLYNVLRYWTPGISTSVRHFLSGRLTLIL